jgi:hypothetical protein
MVTSPRFQNNFMNTRWFWRWRHKATKYHSRSRKVKQQVRWTRLRKGLGHEYIQRHKMSMCVDWQVFLTLSGFKKIFPLSLQSHTEIIFNVVPKLKSSKSQETVMDSMSESQYILSIVSKCSRIPVQEVFSSFIYDTRDSQTVRRTFCDRSYISTRNAYKKQITHTLTLNIRWHQL